MLILTNRNNWVQSGDRLVFVYILAGGRHDHEYPLSILDAIRVTRQKLEQAGIQVESLTKYGAQCDAWSIVIPSGEWFRALDIMNDIFYHYDFGDRLVIYRLDELDWEYNPAQPEIFTRNADYVEEAANIAEDLSDWTGFNVEFHDTSIDKGYWRVVLPTDEERDRFADSCAAYEAAQRRISECVLNGVLFLTSEQYEKAKPALDKIRWKRTREHLGGVLVLFDDTHTRQIVAVMDAAGV